MILTAKNLAKAYKKRGSIKKTWKFDFPQHAWKTVQKVYTEAVADGIMPVIRPGAKSLESLKHPKKVIEGATGAVKAMETRELALPRRGIKRYLFTCAQNNTDIFKPFWENLLVLRDHYDAKLHVSRLVYLTNSTSSVLDKKRAFERIAGIERRSEEIKWAPELDSYHSDERLEVAPGLVWCGEQNIIPTAERPLRGLEVYTGRKSGIIPHVKIAMDSVPSSKHTPTKFNYTTGTVTQRNYIQRKAGLKAQFHHCYGALLVEVDADGNWFCRQINADSDGMIYDLDICVHGKVLTTGNTVEAITWGDIHVAQLEPLVKQLAWGLGGMCDVLQPTYQFFHDVLDFRARSHHELKKPHMLFKRYINGETDVEGEAKRTADFLRETKRDMCDSIVVDSNHHHHLGRWLEEQDARFDPKNVEFWTEMHSRVYESIRAGVEQPNYFHLMLEAVDPDLLDSVTVLSPDESFIICPDRAGGIESGMHGHAGPNGSRGTPLAFTKLGRKANIGHFHSASIVDGVYVAGTCSRLDPDWTTGPSSWSHSHILTYKNGKRAIITMWNGMWRA